MLFICQGTFCVVIRDNLFILSQVVTLVNTFTELSKTFLLFSHTRDFAVDFYHSIIFFECQLPFAIFRPNTVLQRQEAHLSVNGLQEICQPVVGVEP